MSACNQSMPSSIADWVGILSVSPLSSMILNRAIVSQKISKVYTAIFLLNDLYNDEFLYLQSESWFTPDQCLFFYKSDVDDSVFNH